MGPPATSSHPGQLPRNLLNFCRLLRSAGLPVGADQLLHAGSALALVGLDSRERVYWALRTNLVRDPGQFEIFDQAFRLYFRNPRLLEQLMGQLLPTLQRPVDDDEAGRQQVNRRLRDALGQEGGEPGESVLLELDRSGSSSDAVRLARKDFAQMSREEYAEALELLRRDWRAFPPMRIRRYRRTRRRGQLDLRGTTRSALRRGLGEALPVLRCRRRRPPDLVLLVDVSGSVSAYGRSFLQFAHLLAHRYPVVRCFVFGTRLTDVSRLLHPKDPDRALASITATVPDWDGGTRIAACLQEFNRIASREVLSRPATVLLLSDGLERGDPQRLQEAMATLQRRARRIWWMNPLLRYDRFEPLAAGIRAILPHADRVLPCHNVTTLVELASLLQTSPGNAGLPRQRFEHRG
ncbi:MAG: VWA domain-containing protein [Xanthomonadales bacterium]|nr:VWA domain-containing protein [Xanthomonadales bacterium]